MFILSLQIRLQYYRSTEEGERSQIKSTQFSDNFTQRLDHFNPNDTRTFPQLYHVNDEYYKQSSGIIILQVGGEGPTNIIDVTDIWSADYFAKNLSALNVELEHRYYGESIPPHNLTYLSSRQALADLVEFAHFLKAKYNATKIVAYGGSYPGNLAGWARSQFPHVFDAAIASSGPITGKVQFTAFMDFDGDVLENVTEGCKRATKTALEDFQQLLKDDQKAAAALLQRPDLEGAELTNLDRSSIISGVADFPNLIQRMKEGAVDVLAYCARMVAAEAKTDEYFRWLWEGKPNLGPLTFAETVAQTKKSNMWTWQTCTEFGYFQDSFYFTNAINMSMYYNLCFESYKEYYAEAGITNISQLKTFLTDQVEGFLNSYFGARNQPRSKIYYTNGGYDPWSILSMRPDFAWVDGQYRNEATENQIVEKGNHCSDMRMSWKSNDKIRLKQLEKLIEWLK